MRRVNLDAHADYVGNRPPLLSRTERNRRAMNGIPANAPGPLIRKESERRPLISLEAMDQAAKLELARKAQLAGSTGSTELTVEVPRGAEEEEAEAAEARRRQAFLAEKERSRAAYLAEDAKPAAPAPKPGKGKKARG